MPQYYQDQQRAAPAQQRPNNIGSVRLARERAEALAQEQAYAREQQANQKWNTRPRNDGRHYVPEATTRPMMNNPAPRNADYMRPPPPVSRGATFYSSGADSVASSLEDLTMTPNERDRGEMAQDFQFPQVPKSTTLSPQRGNKNQRPQVRQQMAPQPTPDSPAWPLPKTNRAPSSQAPPKSAMKQSNAPLNPPRKTNPYERESIYSKASEPGTPPGQRGVFRQASQGKRAKPVLTTIQSPVTREQHMNPASPRARTTIALSAAIAAGMAPSGSRPQTPRSQVKGSTTVRMPFADDTPPHSPTVGRQPLEPPPVFGRSPITTSDSSTSTRSYNPLLGTDPRPAMSDRIPSSRRPARLNIDAVREAESRGSTTSLADLIKRATKLASNLDRGKTASRLGMLDMFNAGEKDEKHTSGSLSDMLSAFPEPGMTPTSQRHDPRFPPGSSHLKDGEFAPHDSHIYQRDKRAGRKCCGMSLTAFFLVMIVLIILIAAAVLVPIFLIVIPNMQKSSTSLADCSASHPCQNMGVSVVSNNQCSCVCTNGYTGSRCTQTFDSSCITTPVTIDGRIYNDASAGNLVPDVLSGADKNFSIPLNTTALLSLFAANNLSCATENSLISFNVDTQTTKKKRFLPIHLPLPTPTPQIQPRAPLPSTVASSNGIVYQASSTSSSTSAPTSSSTSTSSSQSSTPISPLTLSFAQTVVLYIFEQSSTLSIAVNAQQTMQSYLANVGGDANNTLAVGFGDLHVSADFANFEILFGNGTVVGGQGGKRLRGRGSWEGWGDDDWKREVGERQGR